MSCFHPLKGFDLGVKPNGKKDLYVCSYDIDHIDIIGGCARPSVFHDADRRGSRCIRDYLLIPCGRCDGCLLDRSRDWATRLMLEALYYDQVYFITLTYNDNFLPVSYYGSGLTGECVEVPTLYKRDCQLFMKRLRRRFEDCQIRFYLIGEYGPTTKRAHYHAIIFGLPELELIPSGKNALGQRYYTSSDIQKCWSPPEGSSIGDDGMFQGCQRRACPSSDRDLEIFGHISVEPATYNTCAYTARYCTKKLLGDSALYYEMMNIEPPFSLMSRKPGLGFQYYAEHKDQIYEYDEIILSLKDRGKKCPPPKYFNALYDIDEHDIMESIKAKHRESAEAKIQAELMRTDLDYLDLLKLKEAELKRKTSVLQRKDL